MLERSVDEVCAGVKMPLSMHSKLFCVGADWSLVRTTIGTALRWEKAGQASLEPCPRRETAGKNGGKRHSAQNSKSHHSFEPDPGPLQGTGTASKSGNVTQWEDDIHSRELPKMPFRCDANRAFTVQEKTANLFVPAHKTRTRAWLLAKFLGHARAGFAVRNSLQNRLARVFSTATRGQPGAGRLQELPFLALSNMLWEPLSLERGWQA
jgi:hypothetical protein